MATASVTISTLSDDDQQSAYRSLMQARAIITMISASATGGEIEPEELQFACWAAQEQLDNLGKIVNKSPTAGANT